MTIKTKEEVLADTLSQVKPICPYCGTRVTPYKVYCIQAEDL